MPSYRTLAAQIRLLLDKQDNIAGMWDGKTSGTAEDAAHTASALIEHSHYSTN
jgi:hypothetical protein